MKTTLLLGAACALLAGAPALAQTQTSTTVQQPDGSSSTTTKTVEKDNSGAKGGAVGGAIAGAVVAGPIGAVVGGIAGATIGHTVAPPTEVKTYVTTQNGPPVTYSGPVEVGRKIDSDVAWQDVPKYPKYSWANMNGQRVVIDNASHNVVAVY